MKFLTKIVAICLLFATVAIIAVGIIDWKGGREGIEQQLSQRVQARWDALVARDFAVAYQLETPGYREVYSLKQYEGRAIGDISYLEAEVSSVAEDGNAAKAIIKVKYRAMIPGSFKNFENVSYVTEKWAKIGDHWFYIRE